MTALRNDTSRRRHGRRALSKDEGRGTRTDGHASWRYAIRPLAVERLAACFDSPARTVAVESASYRLHNLRMRLEEHACRGCGRTDAPWGAFRETGRPRAGPRSLASSARIDEGRPLAAFGPSPAPMAWPLSARQKAVGEALRIARPGWSEREPNGIWRRNVSNPPAAACRLGSASPRPGL